MLHYLVYSALPVLIIGQTYYMNFIFNNNRYLNGNVVSPNGTTTDVKNANDFNSNILPKRAISEAENNAAEEVNDNNAKTSSDEYESSSRVKRKRHKDHAHSYVHKHSDSVEVIHSVNPISTATDENIRTDEKIRTDENIDTDEVVIATSAPLTTRKPTNSSQSPFTSTTTAVNTDADSSDSSVTWSFEIEHTTPKILGAKPTMTIVDHGTEYRNITTTYMENTTYASLMDDTSTDSSTIRPWPNRISFEIGNAKCLEERGLDSVFGLKLTFPYMLNHKVLCKFPEFKEPWLLIHRHSLPTKRFYENFSLGFLSEDEQDYAASMELLSWLSRNKRLALMVTGQNSFGRYVQAHYVRFVVNDFRDSYTLAHLFSYTGNASDWMAKFEKSEFVDYTELYLKKQKLEQCDVMKMGGWWTLRTRDCIFPYRRDQDMPGSFELLVQPNNIPASFDNEYPNLSKG